MDVLCNVCELVVAVCTLVYLFNLQQATNNTREGRIEHVRREMALGFLTLAFTVATLVVMAIGIEKLVQSGRAAWARVSGNRGATLPDGGVSNVHSEVNTSVGAVPAVEEDSEHDVQSLAESGLLAGSQIARI